MQPFSRPILIVEDDLIMRYVLGRLVRLSGHATLSASSVAAGLTLLEAHPQCVVIDLNLPDGDGEVILHTVRERSLACRAVVCTGVTDPGRLQTLEALAPDAILSKPVLVDEFLGACLGDPVARTPSAPATRDALDLTGAGRPGAGTRTPRSPHGRPA
jgi:CheY-like chemotaxis protein